MWSQHFFKKQNRGVSVIEILIGSAVISLSIIFIANVYGNLVALSSANTAKVQAVFLLDEGVAAIKTMRAEKWSNIASSTASTTYYLYWNTDKWRATTTPSLVDNMFVRTYVLTDVKRDASTFNIQTDGSGTIDTGTRKVDISVSWLDKGATTTRTTSMYIFNLYE